MLVLDLLLFVVLIYWVFRQRDEGDNPLEVQAKAALMLYLLLRILLQHLPPPAPDLGFYLPGGPESAARMEGPG